MIGRFVKVNQRRRGEQKKEFPKERKALQGNCLKTISPASYQEFDRLPLSSLQVWLPGESIPAVLPADCVHRVYRCPPNELRLATLPRIPVNYRHTRYDSLNRFPAELNPIG